MTINVSKQVAYTPTIQKGIRVTKQVAYVPVYDGSLTPSPATGRRRQLSASF